MNLHYQIIRTSFSHIFLLCFLVLSFCVSCNVGKPIVRQRNSIITCIDQERDALHQFKNHIRFDYCGLLDSWGNPNTPDCCTWEGVTCSNQSGHVIELHLSGAPYNKNCLDIPVLSPSLGELKYLKYLDFSSNYFYVKDIPSSVGSLANLVYLDLSRTVFNGNIPDQLGNLTSLTSLDLSNIIGLYATSLNWLSRLTLLRDINLSGNDLSKAKDLFQSIGSLPSLEVLNMDHCQLPPPLPSSSFLQYPNLRVISLSGTEFSSSSSSFQWMFDTGNYSLLGESLKHLDMSYSNLQGPIPDAIGKLESLTYLDLSGNSLSRNIPDAIGKLESLTYLDLSGNSLSRNIPDAIGKLESLTYLDLSMNSLSRNIPDAIGKLESLTYLDLSRNSLSRNIPDAIGKLESLTYLDLSGNSLSKNIPDAIGKLEFLTQLDLSGNLLPGIIPDAITNLHSLTYMDLSNNSLSGSIPSTLGTMHSLSYLDLSYNRLEDSIPCAIGDSHTILLIDLSNNRLQGPIPSSLGGASSLSSLVLSNNHLQGPIPSSIANLEYLDYLDLSRNDLTGDIPCKLGIKKLLSFADFSHNNLSGSIPKHLSDLGPDAFQGNPNFRTDRIQGRCDKINVGLYVSIGLGFYTGFWAFCGTLTVKTSWRHAYFRFVDHILDNIYVTVAVNLARLRRNSQV